MPVLGFLDRGGLAGKPLSGDPIGFPGTPGERGSFCVGSSEGSGSDGGVWSSVTDSNRGESLIDLKLGRLDDCRYGKTVANLKGKIGFSSLVSKGTRFGNSNNQIPRCQVLGCNMDLSSCKEYNKRHKVCELHTKTAKVVVNDLEKRFCQQCSRFHLLAEFDESKRSCRKRLASHNERRRKHNRDTNSGQFRRLLPTHYDDKFPAPSLLPKTPFIFPEIFSSGTLREVKYRNSTGCRGSKVEEEAIHNCNLHFPTTNEFLFPKPSFPVHSMEKPLPGLQEIESMGGSFYCESSGRYLRTFTNDNPSFFDGSSAIEGFSRPRDSDCALYLLSSQSQEPPAQSFSFPSVGPTHRNVDQFSEKILELQASSQASTSGGSTRFSPSGINSVGDDQLGPVLVSDASDAIDFEVQTDGLFQNSDYANDKDGIYQGLHTVDLLQLSSQFQGAKNQMHMQQEKLENEIFFWDPIA